MTPLYISIGSLNLRVLPDTQAHANGHAVITYTYHIFKNIDELTTVDAAGDDITLQLNATNINYLGYITFDHPGRMFTYTSNGANDLDSDEVQQLIEQINYYRDHPELWRF